MISETVLASYEALVATRSGLERRGKTMPYTSINGHMFSFLTPDGVLALRLPAEQRDAFLDRYGTRLVEQHGALLKEYVAVPPDLLDRLEEMRPWFDQSFEYVSSLKPKKTTRT